MKWHKKYLTTYKKPYSEVNEEIKQCVRDNIRKINQMDTVLVASVIVIAHNEGERIFSCLWSLSENSSDYKYEIIVVNNHSTDNTCEVLQDIGVRYFNEPRKGPGFARNCGLYHAKGKYTICIDADTLYPPTYIDRTIKYLMRPDVVCTYGLWNFIPEQGYPRWQLYFYELIRNFHLRLQNIKRPELCVRGMCFAFDTIIGKEIGFRTDIIRGEDGSLAFAMKKKGKLFFITDRKCVVYTDLGTLKKDGSFYNSFKVRFVKALKGIGGLLTRKEQYEDKADNIIKE